MLPPSLKRRIHFFVIALAAALVLGQRAAADSPFTVDVWNTEDGLPQSSVIAITQTRDGYLWLGTLNGLVRFDGNSFTRFNVNNTSGLPGNGIIFLFDEGGTNLWAGTENAGLCLIKNGVVQKMDTGGAGRKIIGAFADETGAVWFATDDQNFFRWWNGRMEFSPQMYPAQRAYLRYRAFHLVVPARGGANWQLQNGRVEKWSGDKREMDFGAAIWTNAIITAALEDAEGNLVVGTRGSGVFWFDATGHCQRVFEEEDQTHRFVLSLCFDRDGNLWVGTDGGGLVRVKRKVFSTLDELAGGVALSAAEDGQGGLWTTFNLRGLAYSLTNSVRRFNIGRESKPGPVLVDAHQQIWAGTSGEGLFRSVAGNFEPPAGAEIIGRQIYALFQGREGKIWAGGKNGLGGYDGQVWNFFSIADGLPPNAIRAFADDDKGNLWIGTEGGGLFKLRDGKISPVHAPFKDVSCLLVDHEGVLWAGTSAHGLARLQAGTWTEFTEDDG